MKLFEVTGVAIHSDPTALMVAENAKQAEERFMQDEDSYILTCHAREITEIDGYKVVFKKGKKIVLQRAGGEPE